MTVGNHSLICKIMQANSANNGGGGASGLDPETLLNFHRRRCQELERERDDAAREAEEAKQQLRQREAALARDVAFARAQHAALARLVNTICGAVQATERHAELRELELTLLLQQHQNQPERRRAASVTTSPQQRRMNDRGSSATRRRRGASAAGGRPSSFRPDEIGASSSSSSRTVRFHPPIPTADELRCAVRRYTHPDGSAKWEPVVLATTRHATASPSASESQSGLEEESHRQRQRRREDMAREAERDGGESPITVGPPPRAHHQLSSSAFIPGGDSAAAVAADDDVMTEEGTTRRRGSSPRQQNDPSHQDDNDKRPPRLSNGETDSQSPPHVGIIAAAGGNPPAQLPAHAAGTSAAAFAHLLQDIIDDPSLDAVHLDTIARVIAHHAAGTGVPRPPTNKDFLDDVSPSRLLPLGNNKAINSSISPRQFGDFPGVVDAWTADEDENEDVGLEHDRGAGAPHGAAAFDPEDEDDDASIERFLSGRPPRLVTRGSPQVWRSAVGSTPLRHHDILIDL